MFCGRSLPGGKKWQLQSDLFLSWKKEENCNTETNNFQKKNVSQKVKIIFFFISLYFSFRGRNNLSSKMWASIFTTWIIRLPSAFIVMFCQQKTGSLTLPLGYSNNLPLAMVWGFLTRTQWQVYWSRIDLLYIAKTTVAGHLRIPCGKTLHLYTRKAQGIQYWHIILYPFSYICYHSFSATIVHAQLQWCNCHIYFNGLYN